ncbi:MAG: hypothetical protein EZS28_039905 [Streblomastix strix]|uniref:Uncharacterized protein n=1 Tax=Streblomastix strix TaxID=222440 RepID=A0A5J4U2P4_9EUKA|nr:MAG: hypothetical protein EZS28_039905 [Streblomastix strix]
MEGSSLVKTDSLVKQTGTWLTRSDITLVVLNVGRVRFFNSQSNSPVKPTILVSSVSTEAGCAHSVIGR